MSLDLNYYVGQRALRRRRNLAMTQAEVADRMGIAPQQIQKYEQGASQMSLRRVSQLSSALEVPLGYFFDGFNPVARQD